jgi:hypothetical protein
VGVASEKHFEHLGDALEGLAGDEAPLVLADHVDVFALFYFGAV